MKIQRRPLHHIVFSKAVRRTAASIVGILVLVIGAALLYTWLMNRNGNNQAVEGAATTLAPRPLIEHTPPDPNGQVGVSVQIAPPPIPPGSEASINIKTYPEAVCTIKATYNEVDSTDAGLWQQTADEYGLVAWTWFVEPTVPQGTWPVNVTCSHHGKTGTVRASLVVKEE